MAVFLCRSGASLTPDDERKLLVIACSKACFEAHLYRGKPSSQIPTDGSEMRL